MSWEEIAIGSLVTLKQGFAINKKTNHHMSKDPTSLHLLRIGDMKDGNFSIFVKNTIPQKFIAGKDDIIYTRTGQVGLVFRRQSGVVHNNCFTVTTRDNTKLRQAFLYYALQNKTFYEEAISRATGAAQPDLPHEAFNSIKIVLPPTEFQDKIVKILDAYDDLIENNQKQIKLLEEAAQRLYKQWFIDLRYPGHETTPIVDGLPEGWRKESIENCLEMHIGGGWGKDAPDGKNTIAGKVIRGTDINDVKSGEFDNIPIRFHTENDMKKRKLCEYDIVFELSNGNINNIGRSLLIDSLLLDCCGENSICASFCKLLRPKDKFLSILMYWEIQEMQTSGRMLPFKKHGSNGINNFDFEGFLKHELVIPDNQNLMNPFFEIMKKIANIRKAFSLLKESRDRLLPKLVNGELEV